MSIWWAKFFLLITVTVAVTWLILRLDTYIGKHSKSRKKRYTFRGLIWMLLNLRDLA
jgi:hypothetical protein